MRIFDIIIVIITIIIIISSIILFIYLNNKINDNNINNEINEKIKIMTSDIDINAKNIKSFKDNYERNNYKLDDGEVVIFTTDKNNKNKILSISIIKVKAYGQYINDYYSIISTEPFYYQPKLFGNNYIHYLYGIKINKRIAYYTAPYINIILDDKNEIKEIENNDVNNKMGLVILSDDNNTSIKYLVANNEIVEGNIPEDNIYMYTKNIVKFNDNNLAHFKYLSSYALMDNDKPLIFENKKYLMSFKDVYGIYPGVINKYLENKKNKKED